MTINRQPLTLEEGIAHFEMTKDDIARVEDIVLAAGAESAYLVPSDSHVGFLSATGEAVAYLMRSYIIVTPRADVQPEGDRPTSVNIEPGGVDVFLSNWTAPRDSRGHHSGNRTEERLGNVCPIHFEVMSLTGTCGSCE